MKFSLNGKADFDFLILYFYLGEFHTYRLAHCLFYWKIFWKMKDLKGV